ncbi:MAG TPA: hypothetical protein VMR21_01320 [Vicinamibacteria bacterium]|nr:hypothetical protein [Vicinamibacteria bacterium]
MRLVPAAPIVAAVTLSVGSLLPPALQAQTDGPPTVRVQLRNLDLVHGYLRGRSADEVVIFTREGRYRHLPLGDIQRLEVRTRTGSHAGRGALIGALAWGSVMAAAALGSLDDAGVASWQSGAILAGGVGIGTLIGSRVPRYGWRATEPGAVAAPARPAGLQVTIRF